MSYSSLFIVNKDLYAAGTIEFPNSWLFAIPIFNYLVNKYASEEEKQAEIRLLKIVGSTDYDEKAPINAVRYFGFDPENKKINAINDFINNSSNLSDRIGWELVNQQMFYSKDKNIVANAILELQKNINTNLERFCEVIDSIKNIDENATPFFIWKNNSVDDGVENLFSRYDEKLDDDVKMNIWEYMKLYKDNCPLDLIIIKNNKMSFGKITDLRHKNKALACK